MSLSIEAVPALLEARPYVPLFPLVLLEGPIATVAAGPFVQSPRRFEDTEGTDKGGNDMEPTTLLPVITTCFGLDRSPRVGYKLNYTV